VNTFHRIICLAGLIACCSVKAELATVEPFWPAVFEHQPNQSQCAPGTPVERWATYYATHPTELSATLLRARPWLAHVAAEVRQRKLPAELILVPIAESGYDNFARSPRDAAGAWQLMPETAIALGLTINRWYDGRHDMLAATAAALDYFSELYQRFDRRLDLTLAAYNAGPGRVSRILDAGNTEHAPKWSQLALPGETRTFIARVLGLGCLFSEPHRYQFDRPVLTGRPGFVKLKTPGPLDLIALANKADIEPELLLHLNSGLKSHLTPPLGPHRVLVPHSQAETADRAIQSMQPARALTWTENHHQRQYEPSEFARRHGIDPEFFIHLNRLDSEPIQVGQQLLLPSNDSRPLDPAYRRNWQFHADWLQSLHPELRLRHLVRHGEDLWTLSQRYTVSADRIRQWNGLSPSAPIRPGQLLEIPPSTSALALNEYQAQPGDSLWAIARMHGLSVEILARLNGIPIDYPLSAGRILIIGEEGCCNPLERIPAL
jgi:membrane-bound lytic murein transglycosylase D